MTKKTDKKEFKEIKKDLNEALKNTNDNDLEESDKTNLKRMIRFSNEEERYCELGKLYCYEEDTKQLADCEECLHYLGKIKLIARNERRT